MAPVLGPPGPRAHFSDTRPGLAGLSRESGLRAAAHPQIMERGRGTGSRVRRSAGLRQAFPPPPSLRCHQKPRRVTWSMEEWGCPRVLPLGLAAVFTGHGGSYQRQEL